MGKMHISSTNLIIHILIIVRRLIEGGCLVEDIEECRCFVISGEGLGRVVETTLAVEAMVRD
jgi:hypothetical protein